MVRALCNNDRATLHFTVLFLRIYHFHALIYAL